MAGPGAARTDSVLRVEAIRLVLCESCHCLDGVEVPYLKSSWWGGNSRVRFGCKWLRVKESRGTEIVVTQNSSGANSARFRRHSGQTCT